MSLFDPYVRKCYSPDVPPWLNLSMTGLGNVPSKYQPRESNSQLLILDPKSIVIGPLYILLFTRTDFFTLLLCLKHILVSSASSVDPLFTG